jgi:hypothetical protein
VPVFAPAAASAVVALLLSREYAAQLAYIGGSLGTLLGADVLNLGNIQGLGAPVASIGGAGTFDGIFLTGILAVLIASLSQWWGTPSRDAEGTWFSTICALAEELIRREPGAFDYRHQNEKGDRGSQYSNCELVIRCSTAYPKDDCRNADCGRPSVEPCGIILEQSKHCWCHPTPSIEKIVFKSEFLARAPQRTGSTLRSSCRTLLHLHSGRQRCSRWYWIGGAIMISLIKNDSRNDADLNKF